MAPIALISTTWSPCKDWMGDRVAPRNDPEIWNTI